MLAVGAEEDSPEGFEIPFKRTSDYLNMKYQASIYYSTAGTKPVEELENRIKLFIKNLGNF
jgi:hypothetical protein